MTALHEQWIDLKANAGSPLPSELRWCERCGVAVVTVPMKRCQICQEWFPDEEGDVGEGVPGHQACCDSCLH